MQDQLEHFNFTDGSVLSAGEWYLRVHRQRLQSDLMTRVRASVSAHKPYTTVRREDKRRRVVYPGVEVQCLRQDPHFTVELWSLEQGAQLQWPHDAVALEVLVVEGEIGSLSGDRVQAAQHYGYFFCEDPLQWSQWIAQVPTSLYVRQRRVPLESLLCLEAHWWRLAAAAHANTRSRRWSRTSPGVDVMALCGDKQVMSMLVRFEAGACVLDHQHAVDEDCLVLRGEMFLGDILLRTGDYQLAPAGGAHFDETSDVGATFYFHGALDPALLSTASTI